MFGCAAAHVADVKLGLDLEGRVYPLFEFDESVDVGVCCCCGEDEVEEI